MSEATASATETCRCGNSLKHGRWWIGHQYVCAICAAKHYTELAQPGVEDYRRQFEEDEK